MLLIGKGHAPDTERDSTEQSRLADATRSPRHGVAGVGVERSSPTGEQPKAARGMPQARGERVPEGTREQGAPKPVGRRHHHANPVATIAGDPLPLPLGRSRSRAGAR
jgi:hypothetical protein